MLLELQGEVTTTPMVDPLMGATGGQSRPGRKLATTRMRAAMTGDTQKKSSDLMDKTHRSSAMVREILKGFAAQGDRTAPEMLNRTEDCLCRRSCSTGSRR
jgi:hypothetical protein